MADTKGSKFNDYAHAKGVPPEEMAKRYTEWAQDNEYEKDLVGFYKGPQYLTDHVTNLFPDQKQRESMRIITWLRLYPLGFKNMDALEPSQGMVDILNTKGIYNRNFVQFLGDKAGDIELRSYDLLTVCGGMGENHIPCSGIDDMAELVKPGGYVMIVMREAYLTTVEDYRDRLEPRMKQLETFGKWKMISRTVFPKYSFDNNGVIFVFQVL